MIFSSYSHDMMMRQEKLRGDDDRRSDSRGRSPPRRRPGMPKKGTGEQQQLMVGNYG